MLKRRVWRLGVMQNNLNHLTKRRKRKGYAKKNWLLHSTRKFLLPKCVDVGIAQYH